MQLRRRCDTVRPGKWVQPPTVTEVNSPYKVYSLKAKQLESDQAQQSHPPAATLPRRLAVKRRSSSEAREQANTLYRELRELDFMSHLVDQTLMMQCEWAVDQGLDRTSFLRVVYYAGCHALWEMPPKYLGLIAAARGAEMSQEGRPDDLPF